MQPINAVDSIGSLVRRQPVLVLQDQLLLDVRLACSNGSAIEDGFAVTGLRPGNPMVGNFFGGNFYETSLGFNYKPNGNLTIRPECRYDVFQSDNANVGSQDPFNDNTAKNQFLLGIDAIYQW